MGYFIWLIVGIVLLTITIFVHKNTYEQDWGKVGDKLPTPRWLYIVAIVVAFTPILNVIAFAFGLLGYCIGLGESDIVFHCESRWWKSLMGWLTKEV